MCRLYPELVSGEHGLGRDRTVSDGFFEFVQTPHAALTYSFARST